MSIGVVLPVGDGVGNTADNVVESAVALAREAADLGLRSAWLPQRFDFDSVALAGIVGREVPELSVGGPRSTTRSRRISELSSCPVPAGRRTW